MAPGDSPDAWRMTISCRCGPNARRGSPWDVRRRTSAWTTGFSRGPPDHGRGLGRGSVAAYTERSRLRPKWGRKWPPRRRGPGGSPRSIRGICASSTQSFDEDGLTSRADQGCFDVAGFDAADWANVIIPLRDLTSSKSCTSRITASYHPIDEGVTTGLMPLPPGRARGASCKSHATACILHASGGAAHGKRWRYCALRCDRPKRRTVALRASAGSTEVTVCLRSSTFTTPCARAPRRYASAKNFPIGIAHSWSWAIGSSTSAAQRSFDVVVSRR
jgi:hypothetical protein